MGQYHIPVNLDKREFINPHKLGAGLKQWEQLANHPSTGAALLVLLFSSNGRGGGDLDAETNWHGPDRVDFSKKGPDLSADYKHIASKTVGRWAGDRIAIVGDYSENHDLPLLADQASKIYGLCESDPLNKGKPGQFNDITDAVCAVIEHELGGTFGGDGWRTFVSKAEKERAAKLTGDAGQAAE